MVTFYEGRNHHGKVVSDVAGPLTTLQNTFVRGDTPLVSMALTRGGRMDAETETLIPVTQWGR